MFETPLTVVGTVVTDPIRRTVAGQELIKLRVASNSRRRDADGAWSAGNSLYITVSCWGRLITGVGAAVAKGAPVIVVGTIHTNEYEDKDGVRRSTVEMRASAVGPDLSRCVARIEKISYAGPDNGQRTDTVAVAGTVAKEGDSTEDGEPPDDVESADDQLPGDGQSSGDGEDDSPADLSATGVKGLYLSA